MLAEVKGRRSGRALRMRRVSVRGWQSCQRIQWAVTLREVETCRGFSSSETGRVVIVVENSPGERIDAFLAARLADLSRSRIQTLIREQYIQLNGHPAKPRDAVKLGDRITIVIPEAVPLHKEAQDIPLDILFEDDDLVVLNKPRHGRPPRPGKSRRHPGQRPAPPLPAASSPASAASSARASSTVSTRTRPAASSSRSPTSPTSRSSRSSPGRTHGKALPRRHPGHSEPAKDTIFTHIGRHPVNRQKMAVVNPPGGKTAITDYEILATDADHADRARPLPPPHRPHPPDPRPPAPHRLPAGRRSDLRQTRARPPSPAA